MTAWEETSYPVPRQALRVSCLSCGEAIAGGRRGSANIRSILKVLKTHDEAHHPPYDPGVIQAVVKAVEELNRGQPAPRRAGRLTVDLAGTMSSTRWRQHAEALERHIGVLVEQRTELERAVDRLTRERDLAVEERDSLRAELIESQKEIDVLQGVRDALSAELKKSQPSPRRTGLLAEVGKVSAAAVVSALVTVGARSALDLDQPKTSAATVVEHADVVIDDCGAADLAGNP